MKTPFDVKELPLSKLEALGIYHDQQLLLSPSQVQALLAGRRTDLISLQEIKGADFLIERLDARLSLRRQDSGEVELFIHPIYKQPRVHPFLNQQETQDLISGKRSFIGKAVEQEEGRSTMLNIEYDPATKDFVSYDVSKVQAPDRVNGMLLSEEEKSTFRRGEVLELEDGTRLRHRATALNGILSNRKALVLSVLLDGGISYLLLRGIAALQENTQQLDHRTPAFNQALSEMEGARKLRHRTEDIPALQTEPAIRKVSR